MDKISWTDHVRNEEVLLRVKEHRNIPHEISTYIIVVMSQVATTYETAA
jgi:hypothetical protein